MEFNVLIGGEAGQGMFSIELELSDLLSRMGYYFFATKNYMSRIRGGHNFHVLRVSDRPVHALSGRPWDMVIALDREETERRHRPALGPGGIFLGGERIRETEKQVRETFPDPTAMNTVLVGIILETIGADRERTAGAAADEGMRNMLRAGAVLGESWKLSQAFPVAPGAGDHCKLDGNQALAMGALLGGCRFMAGYPMTPATSIMVHFASLAFELPLCFEQAEDEIAAVNMALGASYAGVRSMVATAGGGFALMTEAVSLAGMTETPLVVVVGQRPGPATGLPTRTEQGDLNFVIHAGHGEFGRLVFAPGSVEEALALARTSFDAADRYQIPVFLLTDQYLADSVHIVEEGLPTTFLERDYPVCEAGYRRYAFTSDGLSPLTYPGLSEARVRVDSDEHTEDGKITEDLDLRVRMVDKRLKRLERLKTEAVAPTLYGDREADTVILCWGSNKWILWEAVERLRKEGLKTAALHFSQVYPLTGGMVEGMDLSHKTLVGLENNATGQFAQLLKRELGLTAKHLILKYDGECFTVEEVFRRLKELL